jgi:hypothetical protein
LFFVNEGTLIHISILCEPININGQYQCQIV